MTIEELKEKYKEQDLRVSEVEIQEIVKIFTDHTRFTSDISLHEGQMRYCFNRTTFFTHSLKSLIKGTILKFQLEECGTTYYSFSELKKAIGVYPDLADVHKVEDYVMRDQQQRIRSAIKSSPWRFPPTNLETKRIIVAAACKYDDVIFVGCRHFSKDMDTQIRHFKEEDEAFMMDHGRVTQGFVDNLGNFHNREDAFYIALHAGQLNFRRPFTGKWGELFSENLY